jgi:hypothetical protein
MTAYDWSHIQNMICVSILGLAQIAETNCYRWLRWDSGNLTVRSWIPNTNTGIFFQLPHQLQKSRKKLAKKTVPYIARLKTVCELFVAFFIRRSKTLQTFRIKALPPSVT